MGQIADDHGSERHLKTYREQFPEKLDAAILSAVGRPGPLIWDYPDPGRPDLAEPKGIGFLADKSVVTAWRSFWPQTGNQQRWDGVIRLTDSNESLLCEAKANHPEFTGSPCGASSGKSTASAADSRRPSSRRQIDTALSRTKAALGVNRHFSWLGSYYQYANRLAVLQFLCEHGIHARLVFVHFLGDRFPDGRWCPATEAEWHTLIEARRLTLGLPKRHPLSDRIHDVFLTVPR